MMTVNELDAWLTEVMGVNHGDHATFFDLVFTLAEAITFPLPADWLGERVTVLGIDKTYSSHSQGMKANLSGRDEPISFDDLVFVDPAPPNANWLALYNYWREKER